MGVLATRTPHRPVPIGLSTAQVIEVDAAAGVLVLGGVDIVDGSPVLDVKPYVPFSDALPAATAPDWVTQVVADEEPSALLLQAEADDEPLALSGVDINAAALQQLTAAWAAGRRCSLYPTAQHFLQLVEQVLARDIRSLHQRRNVLPVHARSTQQQQQQQQQVAEASSSPAELGDAQGPAASSSEAADRRGGQSLNTADAAAAAAAAAGGGEAGSTQGRYVVGLDGVCVSYDVCRGTGRVHVRGAHTAP
ncbi:TsaA-like domain-containing protein [Scenedesmus sp. NREL 46B-D3]|nr:TsaA-like domain-containing protein [Scenedesmus sp. NREL 46B-D3]